MASSKVKAKLRLLRANLSKKISSSLLNYSFGLTERKREETFQKDTIDEEAIHRNRPVKLKQTLFVIHLKIEKRHSNKSNRAPTKLTLSITTTFFKFAVDISTQCGPIFERE